MVLAIWSLRTQNQEGRLGRIGPGVFGRRAKMGRGEWIQVAGEDWA
jgi:hypothetical protein